MDFFLMIFASIGAGAILSAVALILPVAVTGLIVSTIVLMCGPLVDKLIPKLPRSLANWLNS